MEPKQYYQTDADGKKLIIEKPDGIKVEILQEPSPTYLAAMPPPYKDPTPRDYLAEIDQLKADVEKLKKLP